MAAQLDFWTYQEIERLEKRIASLTAEVMNLREENCLLAMKRHGKKARIAYATEYLAHRVQ